MDKITHEIRLSRWKKVIEQCNARPEGMTAKNWLKEQGITEKKYYYWLRRVRQETYEQMQQSPVPAVCEEVTFAELPALQEPAETTSASEDAPAFRPTAVIHIGSCTVELANSASGPLIKKIMEEAGHAG